MLQTWEAIQDHTMSRSWHTERRCKMQKVHVIIARRLYLEDTVRLDIVIPSRKLDGVEVLDNTRRSEGLMYRTGRIMGLLLNSHAV
jgi:hypothetical protein